MSGQASQLCKLVALNQLVWLKRVLPVGMHLRSTVKNFSNNFASFEYEVLALSEITEKVEFSKL